MTQACREGEKIEILLFIGNFRAAKGGGCVGEQEQDDVDGDLAEKFGKPGPGGPRRDFG